MKKQRVCVYLKDQIVGFGVVMNLPMIKLKINRIHEIHFFS